MEGRRTLRGASTQKGEGDPETTSLRSWLYQRPALFQGFIFACTDGRENSLGLWQLTADRTLGSDTWVHMALLLISCVTLGRLPSFSVSSFAKYRQYSHLLKCLLSSREVRARERNSSSKMFSSPNLMVCLHWAVFTVIAHNGKRDYSVDAVNKTGSR